MNINCQTCKSQRIVSISAHCSDCFHASINGKEHNGYVLEGLGVGSGDDVEISFCLHCGQIQNNFPLPASSLEEQEKCSECGMCTMKDHEFLRNIKYCVSCGCTDECSE